MLPRLSPYLALARCRPELLDKPRPVRPLPRACMQGEPLDANLAEHFLRQKFQRQVAEDKAEASRDWGTGRRLGD